MLEKHSFAAPSFDCLTIENHVPPIGKISPGGKQVVVSYTSILLFCLCGVRFSKKSETMWVATTIIRFLPSSRPPCPIHLPAPPAVLAFAAKYRSSFHFSSHLRVEHSVWHSMLWKKVHRYGTSWRSQTCCRSSQTYP